MAQKINVLVVEPGKAPYSATVEDTMEAFTEIVGQPVDFGCFLPQRVMLIRQEDVGQALPPNRPNPSGGEMIAGTFLLCSFEGLNFISLPPEQMEKFQKVFALPERGEAR